ncbi:hypothetical protein E8E11_011745 [Didymella keratinophila]|nr:hypothetical protein E8E11_011745 [Didymella keratinophila]
MFGRSNNIDIALTDDGNEYGANLTPFYSDEELRNDWIDGWRGASSPETKRYWVHNFVYMANLALDSNLLVIEEFTSILHEILLIEFHGKKDLFPWDRAAVQAVNDRLEWQWQPVCAEAALGLPTLELTPDNPPERNLTPPAISSPEEQRKRKRGRPAGSKDVMKRAGRNTQKFLSKAEKSKRSRQTQKERKAIFEQQLQQRQQQQTPLA